eukprot:4251947-Lingulodinium_polyedra.AAC.1
MEDAEAWRALGGQPDDLPAERVESQGAERVETQDAPATPVSGKRQRGAPSSASRSETSTASPASTSALDFRALMATQREEIVRDITMSIPAIIDQRMASTLGAIEQMLTTRDEAADRRFEQ